MTTANAPLPMPACRPASSLFISLEGQDGGGKSSHIPAIAEWFTSQGRETVVTREPGGTKLAEQLRSMMLHEDMSSLPEVLLAFAARADHIERVIAPALARGAVVICDRFADSSFAYQGAGRGLDWSVLQWLQKTVQTQSDGALLQPDITFLFHLDPQVAAARRTAARDPDRFEAQEISFFERVSQGYMRLVSENPSRFVVLEAQRTQEEVRQSLMDELSRRVAMLSVDHAQEGEEAVRLRA